MPLKSPTLYSQPSITLQSQAEHMNPVTSWNHVSLYSHLAADTDLSYVRNIFKILNILNFSWSLWCPSKLLLSLVPQMGPCRGRGHDRNCSGGRWPLAGCRSYTGHETGHRPKTLRRPRGAGGLSLACSSGSLCCRPVKGPEQTTKCKRVSCESWKIVQSAERKVTSTWELCKFLSNIPGRRIW